MKRSLSQPSENPAPLPPAIVVHGLPQALAALAAAAELGMAVTLISASDAAGYAGPGWFRAVIERACAEYPDVEAVAVLDCGDSPGLALAALRDGAKLIRFAGGTAAKIADIAAQYGAAVIEARPPAFDPGDPMPGRRDLRRACRDYLESVRENSTP